MKEHSLGGGKKGKLREETLNTLDPNVVFDWSGVSWFEKKKTKNWVATIKKKEMGGTFLSEDETTN